MSIERTEKAQYALTDEDQELISAFNAALNGCQPKTSDSQEWLCFISTMLAKVEGLALDNPHIRPAVMSALEFTMEKLRAAHQADFEKEMRKATSETDEEAQVPVPDAQQRDSGTDIGG